jgi:hypothetical protein
MAPNDTADQARQLAQLFLQLSMGVDQYRAAHPELDPDQRRQLADIAERLDDFSEQFSAQESAALLAGIQGNLANIVKATKDAQQAVKTIAKIERVIAITAAAVTLGAAIASGNPSTIASAASGLIDAIAGQKSGSGGGSSSPAGSSPAASKAPASKPGNSKGGGSKPKKGQ